MVLAFVYTILTSVQVYHKALCCLFEAQIQCQTISLEKTHNHGNPQYFHLRTFDPPIHQLPARKKTPLLDLNCVGQKNIHTPLPSHEGFFSSPLYTT